MKKKTTTKKKSARPIPPPPPGWEIVNADDPRLDCLPDALRYLLDERWVLSRYGAGESLPEPHRKSKTYALPIATQSAAPQSAPPSPPMIRLRLPSEKPTREDANEEGNVFTIFSRDGGAKDAIAWNWDRPFDGDELAWFSLPEGILPREPSQEEKWQAEFEECFPDFELTKQGNGEYLHAHAATAWRGFLAAKKGGAE
jgi:hypothetical protein